MENLIDKIKKAFSNNRKLKYPVFDIHFDDENKVVGYVADEIFAEKNDKEAQQLVWKTLKDHLEPDEFLKVSMILPESPHERAERKDENNSENIPCSNYWLHETPDLTKYWLFIDVEKFEDNYKSFFLIINQKKNFSKTIKFNYDRDIITFMELIEDEIDNELYAHAFNQAESEIKLHLMTKYDELSKQGLYGKNNIFYYVFDKFKIKPVLIQQLLFCKEEIVLLSDVLTNINEFKIKQKIDMAIKQSQAILNQSSLH